MESLTDIDAQIAELQKKKAELLRLEAEKPIKIFITNFSKVTGRIEVILSKFDPYIVDILRYMPNRTFTGDKNTINAIDIPSLIEKIEKEIVRRTTYNVLPNLTIEWEELTKPQFDNWINQPDLKLTYNEKRSLIEITPGPKFAGRRVYFSSKIGSFTFDPIRKLYTVAANEAWKIPDEIKYAGALTVEYSDEVRKVIFDQLDRKKLLAEIAIAETIDLDDVLLLNLKDHQKVASKFCELTDDNAIVGYDMGLGKSAIGIDRAERGKYKKILIICPANLKTNWKREIKKFTGHEAIILAGAEPEPSILNVLIGSEYKYFIINYDIIARSTIKDEENNDAISKWVVLLNHCGFDLMIIDEAHYAKNVDSKRSIAVRQFEMPHKILMTGTPLVNRPKELYVPLNMLDPKTFNNQVGFANQFTNFDGTVKNLSQLRDILSIYMIRRSFKDVYKDLEEPNRIPLTKSLTTIEWQHYMKALEGVYISLRDPSRQMNITSVLAELMRCKQITSASNISTSVELAMQAYEETDKKVLIFSQFKDSQAGIQEQLGSSAAIINGDVTDDERYRIVDEFQKPDSDIKFVILNILEGLTMTEAHTVIFNDIWWTPKDHRQAEGRAFGRTNDPHSGNSYYIQNENTIDEFLISLIHEKMAIFKQVIDGTKEYQEANESVVKELIAHLKRGF